MSNAPSVQRYRSVYLLASVWLIATTALHIWINAVIYPTGIYWLSYYFGNYQFGFVRRGLGGQIVALFPDEHYFTAAYTMLWASTAVWLIGLSVLMYVVWTSGMRSERKVMLALLIPVLPFAVSYGLYSPHPELFAMAALIALSIALTKVQTARARVLWSAGYGLLVAVLTFVHEGIPLALGLGAVLAIVVLPGGTGVGERRFCSALAVVPGLIALVVITLFGRRDVGQLLCQQVPHRMMENPYAIAESRELTLQYVLGQIESTSDYHDWICATVGATADEGPIAALRMVANFGFVPLLNSFIVGVLFFGVTMWAIGFVSDVPVTQMYAQLRDRMWLPALAALMVLPLFLAGLDWTRWWVLITADVAIVYLLYAVGRPEVDRPPTKRTVTVFVVLVVILAVVPTGATLHVGGASF